MNRSGCRISPCIARPTMEAWTTLPAGRKEEPTKKEACFGVFLKRAHRSVVKSGEDEVIITQYVEERN